MITNDDLHTEICKTQIMLARIEERQINVVTRLDDVKATQETHQKIDDMKFAEIDKKLSSMTHYATSIALVASAIGAGAEWVFNKLTGKI